MDSISIKEFAFAAGVALGGTVAILFANYLKQKKMSHPSHTDFFGTPELKAARADLERQQKALNLPNRFLETEKETSHRRNRPVYDKAKEQDLPYKPKCACSNSLRRFLRSLIRTP